MFAEVRSSYSIQLFNLCATRSPSTKCVSVFHLSICTCRLFGFLQRMDNLLNQIYISYLHDPGFVNEHWNHYRRLPQTARMLRDTMDPRTPFTRMVLVTMVTTCGFVQIASPRVPSWWRWVCRHRRHEVCNRIFLLPHVSSSESHIREHSRALWALYRFLRHFCERTAWSMISIFHIHRSFIFASYFNRCMLLMLFIARASNRILFSSLYGICHQNRSDIPYTSSGPWNRSMAEWHLLLKASIDSEAPGSGWRAVVNQWRPKLWNDCDPTLKSLKWNDCVWRCFKSDSAVCDVYVLLIYYICHYISLFLGCN